jgi:signal transduction histidine kinase
MNRSFRRALFWTLASAAMLVVGRMGGLALLQDRHQASAIALWQDIGLTLSLAAAAGLAVWIVIFRLRRVERQYMEVIALDQASRDIQSELALARLLEKVTTQARQLIGARYGALSIINAEGRILQFITSGITDEERGRIGPPPQGRGLLGAVLRRGEHLRMPHLQEDPRSYGFPDGHPPMKSLLAVPIPAKTPFRGNLYLTEKLVGRRFTEADEATLSRFASKAAVAIDNAHLHQNLQALAVAEERVRISREMHDGAAQMLAYVSTKAQAVQEFLRRGKNDQAIAQLEELASAARSVYADVREGIVALRTEVGPDRPLSMALGEYIQSWRDRTGIEAELIIEDEPPLAPQIELQVLRIVQEALANIRKHAEAGSVKIILAGGPQELRVVIRDDGRGFDPSQPQAPTAGHFGLVIMRERAEGIGGRLSVESTPGEGACIALDLPLET